MTATTGSSPSPALLPRRGGGIRPHGLSGRNLSFSREAHCCQSVTLGKAHRSVVSVDTVPCPTTREVGVRRASRGWRNNCVGSGRRFNSKYCKG